MKMGFFFVQDTSTKGKFFEVFLLRRIVECYKHRVEIFSCEIVFISGEVLLYLTHFIVNSRLSINLSIIIFILL